MSSEEAPSSLDLLDSSAGRGGGGGGQRKMSATATGEESEDLLGNTASLIRRCSESRVVQNCR